MLLEFSIWPLVSIIIYRTRRRKRKKKERRKKIIELSTTTSIQMKWNEIVTQKAHKSKGKYLILYRVASNVVKHSNSVIYIFFSLSLSIRFFMCIFHFYASIILYVLRLFSHSFDMCWLMNDFFVRSFFLSFLLVKLFLRGKLKIFIWKYLLFVSLLCPQVESYPWWKRRDEKEKYIIPIRGKKHKIEN